MKQVVIGVLLLLSTIGYAKPAPMVCAKPRVEYVLICNSRSAYAYHRYECRGLARCSHLISKITKTQAIKLGYRPCKICY